MAPVAKIATISGILLEGCHGVPLRQEMQHMYRHRSLDLTSDAEKESYPERWYTEQTTDHFSTNSPKTFKHRYFANFDHFKPGGPIFIMIGGEGPLSAGYVGPAFSSTSFAKELHGGTVAVEHRFYGKTQPFDSLATENLKYLTSRQALHDLAQFQKWFIASNSSYASSPVFCMGGSYPGNLAAWYRLEFPDLTKGCWSSSGPVHAQENWPGFGEMVWKALSTDKTGVRDDSVVEKLYAGYQRLAAVVQDPTEEGHQRLIKEFNVCPGTLASQGDRDMFEMNIATYPGIIMQYNNTHTPRLDAIRDIVLRSKTGFDAAIGVSEFLNLTKGDAKTKCTDNSLGTFYKQLSDTTLPDDGTANAGRTWTWQTCNEFGYFQTATSEYGTPNFYTRGTSARSAWQQVCNNIFQINDASIGARIAATNAYYGGKEPKDISHVLFSNGGLDAWSLLSVTEYPANDREVYTEVAPLGSHCVGLYAQMAGEVPGATKIRNRALDLFKKWGAASASGSSESIVV